MAKQSALRDQIMIDGTTFTAGEVRSVDNPAENPAQDASGFSTTGNDESVPGNQVTSLTLEIFHTEETFALIEPLFSARETFQFTWQPDGLVDTSRETLVGNAYIEVFNKGNARGEVRLFTITLQPADATGFHWESGS